jgi:hypothetical protein
MPEHVPLAPLALQPEQVWLVISVVVPHSSAQVPKSVWQPVLVSQSMVQHSLPDPVVQAVVDALHVHGLQVALVPLQYLVQSAG